MEVHIKDSTIRSWQRALISEALDPLRLKVLTQMVKRGEATDLSTAASILDWKGWMITRSEHLYGS